MIKLYLIVLIIIFLIILLFKKETFTTCNKDTIKTGQLVINGGLLNDKIHIFWKIPYGLDPKDSKKYSYTIIYKKSEESNVLRDVTQTIKINDGLYSYDFPAELSGNEFYNITLNMNIMDIGQVTKTISSNTLVIYGKKEQNPSINCNGSPNDIFENLKNKTIQINI